MGSCAAPSAKGDDKFITTDYLQQCLKLYSPFFHNYIQTARKAVTGDLICNLLVKLMYQKRWFL
ncbi:TPA_asm: hypothetical protein G2938_25405 [Salmonella enterica subsp. enterica serovar Livingstone]|nr:hypothetical protein [Salmonella enterica subsp. enterica serovar Livingstone]